MPQFETLKAWIEVEGVALEEYEVEVDEGRRIATCYVPSVTGKAFTVHWSWSQGSASRGDLTVDGQKRLLSQFGQDPSTTAHIDDMTLPDNRNLRAPIEFGEIATTDDESRSLQDEHLVKALGTIALDIWIGNALSQSAPMQAVGPTLDLTIPPPKPIYERMKKAGCHHVVLGTVKPIPWTLTRFISDNSRPVRFVFVYRSKDVLRAQGIMSPEFRATPPMQHPRRTDPPKGRESQSVERMLTKQEADDGPFDEEEDERRLRALEEQQAAIKEQEAAIKEQEAAIKERAAAIKERAAAVKEQAAAVKERMKRRSGGGERRVLKRLKVEDIDAGPAFNRGEIIDLCDD